MKHIIKVEVLGNLPETRPLLAMDATGKFFQQKELPTPVGPPNNEIWYTSSDGNIVIPNQTSSLPEIVSNTYSDGKGVIKFATDVTSIGDGAFAGCTDLTSITIGNSVTSIESDAFFMGDDAIGEPDYLGSLQTITIVDGQTYNYNGEEEFTTTLANNTDVTLSMWLKEEEEEDPSFTIDGNTYYFVEWMTWEDWCNNTTYNTIGAYVDQWNSICLDKNGHTYTLEDSEGDYVRATSSISEDGYYRWV